MHSHLGTDTESRTLITQRVTSPRDLGTVLRNTALFLFHLSVTILAMFYLFRDGESFMDQPPRGSCPSRSLHRDRMIKEARDLIFASVTSSLVAAAAHGLLGGWLWPGGNHGAGFLGRDDGIFLAGAGGGLRADLGAGGISLMLKGTSGAGILLAVFCSVVVGTGRQRRPAVADQRARGNGRAGGFYQRAGRHRRFWIAGRGAGADCCGHGASLLDLYTAEFARAGNIRSASRMGRKSSAVLE